ncbi:MAG: hypothetical protein ABIN69_06905 [Aestuariivirga sp.]
MLRFLLILLFLTGCCVHPKAQDNTPVIGSEASAPQDQPADPATPGLKVLIVGDALAGGMGAGLDRMAAGGEPEVLVINRFNESSGLARPEIYDWASAIANIVPGKDFTSAIVLIGSNDRRDIRTDAGVLAFNSPEWVAQYKLRVDALLDALKAQNLSVIWMGEPPMGEPAYDADMQTITALQKERVLAKGAQFVDLRTPFLGVDGNYTDRGPDDSGADRRLRQSDGYTFLKVGNNRLGQIALAALQGAPPVAAAPGVPADGTGAAVALQQPAIDAPAFGQSDANGAEIIQNGSELKAAVDANELASVAAASSSIGVAAQAGSDADKLFTTGLASIAPAGRFDDQSAAARAN